MEIMTKMKDIVMRINLKMLIKFSPVNKIQEPHGMLVPSEVAPF